ncbi:MAG TPA: hypothetical protein VI382_04095 [Candidatus Manganitrophaceae bacterium]|nr:hypothetical protein [Candidatus Manganitrophaceae bacterium]
MSHRENNRGETKEAGNAGILKYLGALFLILLFAGGAKGEEESWEVGIVGGLYKPSLKTLNRVLSEPRLAILQDPNHQLQPNIQFTPEKRNLPVSGYDAQRAFGLEVRRKIAPRHALLMTLNVWDGETSAEDIAPQITAANIVDFAQVPRSSRYSVFVTQFWVGWRSYFWEPTETSRFHLDVGLIGLAFGQVTIDTLLKVISAQVAQAFPVATSLEAEGWGLTSRWGLGGEYFIKRWLSVSLRGAYIFGKIPQVKVKRFFPSGFSTPPVAEAGTNLQPRPVNGETVTYGEVVRGATPNDEIRSSVRTLPLELNGFEAMGGIHFYF